VHPDGLPTPPPSNNTPLSIEERQAAYLAARERIFAATWRPRSDPVVARRMIAHALGKNSRVIPFPSQTTNLASSADLGGLIEEESPSRRDSPGNEEVTTSVELKESMRQSSDLAAKRIFANALSFSHAGGSPRASLRQAPWKTGPSKPV
jgi:hypothetical protein